MNWRYKTMLDLRYELKKCKECSCSRCNLNGTTGCYIEVAIRELERYEQAFDSMREHDEYKLPVIEL
jgi:hypothetical protein